MIVIEPNGDVYNCIPYSGNGNNMLGNIYKSDIEDIIYSNNNIEHIAKQKYFYCDCEYFHECNGGCYLMKSNIMKGCMSLFSSNDIHNTEIKYAITN